MHMAGPQHPLLPRQGHRRPSLGLSIVELMVGIAISLFIVAGATVMMTSQLGDNRKLLLEAQIQQDMRSAMDMISRDIRRAGYWAQAYRQVWPTAAPMLNPYRGMTPRDAPLGTTSVIYDRSTDEEGQLRGTDDNAVDAVGGRTREQVERRRGKVFNPVLFKGCHCAASRVGRSRCIGIGEAGLDYHYDKSPRDIAARVFRNHIAAARETGLPLVIHSREADDDMAAILRDEMGKGRFNALLHCFTSSRALAETAIELGLYVSFSGVLTFKNSAELRAVAADVPMDRLLVETDAPFLAPVPHRGRPCEPAFVADTARFVAGLRGVTPEHLAETTSRNFHNLFAKAGV